MMDESISNSHKRKRQNSDISEFSLDEIDVANTLINLLPKSKSECLSYSCFRFSYAWVNKRRRSAVVNPTPCKVVVLPPPSSAVVKCSTTSPDTPLGLSTVNDNHDNKFHLSIKKKLQKMIQERLRTQLTLKEKIENMKQHLKELKTQNCELKSEKHKLMEQKTAVHDTLHAGPSTSKVCNQQPPLIPHHRVYLPNQTANIHPCFGGYPELGPRGFDLNVSAEEMEVTKNELQPLDHHHQEMMVIRNAMINRAIAAQARHNRIIINKYKKMARVR